jgi:hypothetical protein
MKRRALLGHLRCPRLRVPFGSEDCPFSLAAKWFALYSQPGVNNACRVKTVEPMRTNQVRPMLPPSSGKPMPFVPTPDELPGAGWDAPIEAPPPAAHRQVKGRIRHCGVSQPIAIADPWQ